MTAELEIDYDALAQEAMRGVVRAVLTRVQKTGLPGEHHFYIAFDTRHSGVVLSKRLKSKYADEMTIVLQHVFWDLIVTEQRFEVKLRFDGVPERLVVPFDALKVFFDPSVPYALQFDETGATRDTGSVVGINEDTGVAASGPSGMNVPALGRDSGRAAPRPAAADRKRTVRRVRDKDGETDVPNDSTEAESPANRRSEPHPAIVAVQMPDDAKSEPAPDAAVPLGPDNVVSLDRFRKKP